ncbi:hypothetical protein ACFC6L_27410 [Kitasatospora phosalacinea]|uniref:RICIN domain-containing protein n=1 Tax=Kitasatospora phosalacinea TaxID=2065 RepID=UPI0035DB5BB9
MRTRLSLRRRVAARLASALTALVAFTAVAGVAATPAQAGDQPGEVWYTGIIRSWAQGRCLDANDKNEVYTIPCNGGQYQQWRIIIVTHAEYEWATVRLQNVQTQRYLDPICDTCGSWQPAVGTHTWLPSGDWLLFPSNSDWSAWRFAWNPGVTQRCLDADTPTDTTGGHPYISFTDWRPNPPATLPPDFCSSNFQDWKLGF